MAEGVLMEEEIGEFHGRGINWQSPVSGNSEARYIKKLASFNFVLQLADYH